MIKFIKLLFICIVIFKLFIIPVGAKDNNYHTYDSKLLKYDKDNYYIITIKDKKYSCIGHNCYDLKSFKYNKLFKTYHVNILMNLMDCNAHQEYKSQYNDGYINHLIFKTSLHDGKITIKCIGFVVSEIKEIYKNGQSYSLYYDNMIIHMTKPKTIKNIKEFESISMDKDLHIEIIKILASN